MEEETDTSICFHECTDTGFHECTEPSVGFHECTEPSVVSLPPARPGPARYAIFTVPPRLLLWLPGLLVLPSIRAALICPALVP